MAEDRKFEFRDGAFFNRVSGEMIPHDEPVMLFRARDRHALAVIQHYASLIRDEHHAAAVGDRIREFEMYKLANPSVVKEPGVTRHIVLDADEPCTLPPPGWTCSRAKGHAGPCAASPAGEVKRSRISAEEYNALSANIRFYIMMLETDADPSGTIRSEMLLRDNVELLEMRINESSDMAVAIGEHAFRAGHAAGFLAAEQTSRSQASHVEEAWSEYDPPEDLKGQSL